MGLRRSIKVSISYLHRLIWSNIRNFRFCRIFIIAIIVYLVILISIQRKILLSTSKSSFDNNHIQYQLTETEKQNENIIINNQSASLFLSKTNHRNTSDQSNRSIQHQARLRYSFIDIDNLNVDINSLDEIYNPKEDFHTNLPSSHSHRYSRLLNVKGDTSMIFYNEIPQSYQFTMGSLLESISSIHSYHYVSSKISFPYIYDNSSLISIARSINEHKFNKLFYKRQIYFFDFYSLKFVIHPVWISLVRDPINLIAAQFEYSRDICQNTKNCLSNKYKLNETLDECVVKYSPDECISLKYGITRMLPFFCGLTNPTKCKENDTWALKQAKQNIDFFYTVIGLTEQFYKYLYVLEKLLPEYFKLSRLVFMNQQDPNELADKRDINFQIPNMLTTSLLKPFLKYEYELYDYIQQRFLDQYRILTELDN